MSFTESSSETSCGAPRSAARSTPAIVSRGAICGKVHGARAASASAFGRALATVVLAAAAAA
ncbi:MAG TPA: hypothetical protein VIR34_14700, partial [Gemmatimonadaceae bacterium]